MKTREEFFEKSMRTLELPLILQILQEEAVCAAAKEEALKLRPSDIPTEVAEKLRETSDAKKLISMKGTPPVADIREVTGSLSRARLGGMLNTRELLDIAGVLRSARQMKSWTSEDAGSLTGLFGALIANKFLEEKITLSIVGEDEIADAASSELASIRRHMRAANARIRDVLNKIITSPSYSKILQEPIITMRSDRYVIPVKAEHKGALGGLVHDVSSSGQTIFIEPMQVVQANNEIRELQAKEKKEIERILMELSNDAAGFEEDILCDQHILVRLDLIFAKAKLSYRMNADAPGLSEDGCIRLKRARHPLIDPKKAVPIDISVGGDFDTLVITGPNTGGKTVSIKTLGVCCLMAACGLHIPADSGSMVPVLKKVLADVGDEQSIEQSLSTFSSHMSNIVGMLKEADEDTLILFDELGAGTDPAEGAALAIAIIEYARSQGAKIAATTHYAELKVYATATAGVMNASCEFDVETLRPTYRLLMGIPGKSNAFEISRRLGLDESIIDDAKRRMASEQTDFEHVVSLLQKEQHHMEQAKLEAEKLRLQAESDARAAAELRKAAEEEKQKAGASAKREADRLLREARRVSDEVFDELNEMRKKALKAENAQQINEERVNLMKKLNEAQDSLGVTSEEAEDDRKPTRPAKAGDTVLLLKLGTQASVISANADGTLTLQAGILRITAKQEEVRLVEDAEKVKAKFKKKTEAQIHRLAVSPEVDLRGSMTDEALLMLERYLDSARTAKLPSVRIIHGKGTGALRKAVQDYLRRDPGVKSFRLGRYGEGEDGVTIAELKI